MSYRLYREAQTDVEAIYRHSYDQFGERQADLYYEGLVERFEWLDHHPCLAVAHQSWRQGSDVRNINPMWSFTCRSRAGC